MIVCFLHTKLSCLGVKLTELERTKVGLCQDRTHSEKGKGVCTGPASVDLLWNLTGQGGMGVRIVGDVSGNSEFGGDGGQKFWRWGPKGSDSIKYLSCTYLLGSLASNM